MTGECFLCGRYGEVQVHHLIPGANRKKSDEYGLTVTLCPDCHTLGPKSVHRNPEVMKVLKKYGQTMWMEKTGGTIEDFIKEFGRNYL